MNNILVTGARRSGTTFLGRMLSLNREISYIHEPFNFESGLKGLSIKKWFPYYIENNITKNDKLIIGNLLSLKNLDSKVSLGDGKTKNFIYDANKKDLFINIFNNFSNESISKRVFRFVLKNRFALSYYKAKFNPFYKRLLIKDPIAALSSQYLANEYNLKVIVIIRHPAAYYYSMKKKNWGIEPKNFLDQKYLNKRISDVFINELTELNNRSEYAVYEWIIINKILIEFAKENSNNFIIVRHEDISLDPLEEFKKLYNFLNIEFTKKIETKIKSYTSSKNISKTDNVSEIKRDASKLIDQWKENLSKEEVEYIKEKTYFIAKDFYKDKSWVI